MKPFRFPLNSIRVLREQKARTAQQRYAVALQTCEAAAARVKSASDELNTCWVTLGRELSAGVCSTQLLRTRAWCNVLELRLKDRTHALEAARTAMDTMWREMMSAMRDREALDRFHDKLRHLYDRDTQREEQKQLDELAVQLVASTAPTLTQSARM